MKKIRQSPTESATLYKIGTKKTGNDGNQWIITENKNGIKRWKLYKKVQNKQIDQKEEKEEKQHDKSDKLVKLPSLYAMYNMPRLEVTEKNIVKWIGWLSQEQKDTFYYFIGVIIPEIRKLGVKFFIVPIGQSRHAHGYYFIDSMPYILKDLYNYSGDDFHSNDTMVAVLHINVHNELADNLIYIYHGQMDDNLKTKFVFLMKKKFKKHYEWNEDNKRNILIKI